jgi:hypothetical protein
MATKTQSQTAGQIAARNTLLIWLGGVIAVAALAIILVYASLRDNSIKIAPLAADRTVPVKAAAKAPRAPATTDSSDAIMREHQSAVSDAGGSVGVEQADVPATDGDPTQQ